MLERAKNRSRTVKIALCGKYVRLHDAYLSVAEALTHAGFENGAKVEIDWVDSEKLTPEGIAKQLAGWAPSYASFPLFASHIIPQRREKGKEMHTRARRQVLTTPRPACII